MEDVKLKNKSTHFKILVAKLKPGMAAVVLIVQIFFVSMFRPTWTHHRGAQCKTTS